MIYEFRTYTCNPGKLPVVLKRFENTTLGLFKKHGIRNGPLLTVAIGDDNQQIKYIIEWESHEERDRAWTAFRADPEWHKAVAESEKDGPTVARISNEILVAAPFSVK
jgi:heme-degrading monooxygenase HmoA